MAVGFQFLSKTSSTQLAGGTVKAAGGQTTGTSGASIHTQNTDKASSTAQKQDMASMSTSDLLKDVYGNKAGSTNNNGNVNIQNHTGEDDTKPDNIKLPLTIEYGDAKFSSHGKKFEDIVKEISQKTHDSTSKVESELKRKYTSASGGSVDINA